MLVTTEAQSVKQSLDQGLIKPQHNSKLATVPPFVTAHTFYASQDIRILREFDHQYNNIFARFMTLW